MTTPVLEESADYVLTCVTAGGSVKTASTTVSVEPLTESSVQVISSVDGSASVARGTSVRIEWDTADAPENSVMSLWLYDERLGRATALIAGARPASGSYDWTVPLSSTACPPEQPYVCASDLVTGRSYAIEAALYTPPNAFLGGFPPENAIEPTYLDFAFGANFLMGQ